MQEAEVCFSENISEDKLVLRNIPTDTILESRLSSVNKCFENAELFNGSECSES